jgi:hypothetical protein
MRRPLCANGKPFLNDTPGTFKDIRYDCQINITPFGESTGSITPEKNRLTYRNPGFLEPFDIQGNYAFDVIRDLNTSFSKYAPVKFS